MWEVMSAVISVYKHKEAVQENVLAPKSDMINSYFLYIPVRMQQATQWPT
jgi:hypothetical protein